MEEKVTKKDVLDRLIAAYLNAAQDGVATVEGSFTSDTLAANAVEFEKAYGEIKLVLEAAFAQTSWGEYLTARAEEHGVMRQAATHALVVLTVAGRAGSTIPLASLFATADGRNFETVEDAVIGEDGSVDVRAQSQGSGSENNVAAGTITKIPVGIYGVSSVNNAAAAYDGFDEETDAALLERLLFKVRQPSTSGNVYHYQLWATSVAGVGAVKVLPLWNGNGTVKVLVVDAEMGVPSEDLLQNVRNEIAANAPIGATVTVAAPETLTVNVALKVTDGVGNSDGIKQVLNDYFKETVFEADNISYAHIGKTILSEYVKTGVLDYVNLTVNGGTVNIPVADGQLPLIGQVTLNE